MEGLLDAGAVKVCAGARDPACVETHGVVPIRLDVTAADIDAALRECDDVTLVINNAGIGTSTGALADDAIEAGRRESETNVFGILSVLSWVSIPATAMYCASKAQSVVEQVVSPLSEGRPEVLPDGITSRIRAGLSGDLVSLYPSLVAS